MALNQWIEQLSDEMELPYPLPEEAHGTYSLPLENGVTVIISEYEQGFSLKAEIAPCPQEKNEELFTEALLANLFGQSTRGAVLGLSEDYRFFILLLEVENARDYKEFNEKLEDFLNIIDFWREEMGAVTN